MAWRDWTAKGNGFSRHRERELRRLRRWRDRIPLESINYMATKPHPSHGYRVLRAGNAPLRGFMNLGEFFITKNPSKFMNPLRTGLSDPRPGSDHTSEGF